MEIDQTSQLLEPKVEKRIIGKCFAIEFLGSLPESNQVLITLPGVGDVATLHFANLTNNLDEIPLGLAISYLHEFEPAELVSGLVTALIDLADNHGQINLVIHACSYGASLLPRLAETLAPHNNISINGIIARAPLFDAATFTERFQNYRKKDKLVLAFMIGLKELFERGEIINSEGFATLSELFALLPERVNPDFFSWLSKENIPLRTILFSKDQIIDREIIESYLGEQKKQITVESSEDRLGHYPANIESFKMGEQQLLVSLFAAE
jgi:hypothetical protein